MIRQLVFIGGVGAICAVLWSYPGPAPADIARPAPDDQGEPAGGATRSSPSDDGPRVVLPTAPVDHDLRPGVRDLAPADHGFTPDGRWWAWAHDDRSGELYSLFGPELHGVWLPTLTSLRQLIGEAASPAQSALAYEDHQVRQELMDFLQLGLMRVLLDSAHRSDELTDKPWWVFVSTPEPFLLRTDLLNEEFAALVLRVANDDPRADAALAELHFIVDEAQTRCWDRLTGELLRFNIVITDSEIR